MYVFHFVFSTSNVTFANHAFSFTCCKSTAIIIRRFILFIISFTQIQKSHIITYIPTY